METTVSRCGTNSFKRWNLSFLHNEPDETTRRIPQNGCPSVHIRIRLSISFIFLLPRTGRSRLESGNPGWGAPLQLTMKKETARYARNRNREQDKREPFRSHLSYNSAQASNSGLYITNYPYLCGVSL